MAKYDDYNRELNEYTETVTEHLTMKLGYKVCGELGDRQIMVLMDLCEACMRVHVPEENCAEEFIRDYLSEDLRVLAYTNKPYTPTKLKAKKQPKQPAYILARKRRQAEWYNAC